MFCVPTQHSTQYLLSNSWATEDVCFGMCVVYSGFIIQENLVNTNTVNTKFRLRRKIILQELVPLILLRLISLRLIRTLDKANRFWLSVGVRIDEVLLYSNMGITKIKLQKNKFLKNNSESTQLLLNIN